MKDAVKHMKTELTRGYQVRILLGEKVMYEGFYTGNQRDIRRKANAVKVTIKEDLQRKKGAI